MKTPPDVAHAPMEMTHLGSGICSYSRRIYGRHLLRHAPCDNHEVALTRRGPKHLGAKSGNVVARASHAHHLDGTAGQAERHRPRPSFCEPSSPLHPWRPARLPPAAADPSLLRAVSRDFSRRNLASQRNNGHSPAALQDDRCSCFPLLWVPFPYSMASAVPVVAYAARAFRQARTSTRRKHAEHSRPVVYSRRNGHLSRSKKRHSRMSIVDGASGALLSPLHG